MADNGPTTLDLKESQTKFLDEMAGKYNLSDRSKALRCLITFAMQATEQQPSIFSEIRCVNC